MGGVGLDIEPDVRVYRQIAANPKALPRMLASRLRDAERPRRARAAYVALIDRIHTDGYRVENYQFPHPPEHTLGHRRRSRRGPGVEPGRNLPPKQPPHPGRGEVPPVPNRLQVSYVPRNSAQDRLTQAARRARRVTGLAAWADSSSWYFV